MEIEFKKVSTLKGFDSREFDLNPKAYGLEWEKWHEVPQALALAEELCAASCDDICIAIVKGEAGEYVLAKEDTMRDIRMILFNAQQEYRHLAILRAITYNRGKGPLSKYWFDQHLAYSPGKVVL